MVYIGKFLDALNLKSDLIGPTEPHHRTLEGLGNPATRHPHPPFDLPSGYLT